MPFPPRLRTGLSLWGPVAACLGGITFLSHQPSLTIPGGLPDWLMHGAEYAILGALVARALSRSDRRRIPAWLAAAAGCAVFGALDEIHQGFVPGRVASLRDVVVDGAGAALALGAGGLIQSRRGRGNGEVDIAIYGRNDCHLCDEAESTVRSVAGGPGVRIRKIDVDQDPELRRLYHEEVPVIMVNGRKLFKHRVDPDRLRRKIASLRQGRTS